MWHQYRVELYPHYGQNSGITDVHGNPEMFPAAFRKDRTTGKEKGIINPYFSQKFWLKIHKLLLDSSL